ncbi:hypothetical protein Sango_2936900 [Sesamum angolense]|uniref:Reverse transcriptase domain-containing protein n=1 Tax=Sesamum angolense TaxID=2727404 RepID=A0AAE1VZZ8_9LAMI|nr:hypothetical protein Sango_2936900 [Sesamum angolense]
MLSDKAQAMSATAFGVDKTRTRMLEGKLRRLLQIPSPWRINWISRPFGQNWNELLHTMRLCGTAYIRGVGDFWVTTENEIQQNIASYFGSVYASNRPSRNDIAKGTEHLRTIINASMRADLLQPYTTAERSKQLSFKWPSQIPRARWIISPSQSGFVPVRLISDNILLAFELNHFLNRKPRCEQGWVALKLDVSKAYDKLVFVICFVFIYAWWETIRVSYSLSGAPPGTPFALHFPSLYRIIQLLITECRIGAMPPGPGDKVLKILGAFSRNTKEELCQFIAGDLTIRRENKMEMYLGLPSRVSRSKRDLLLPFGIAFGAGFKGE